MLSRFSLLVYKLHDQVWARLGRRSSDLALRVAKSPIASVDYEYDVLRADFDASDELATTPVVVATTPTIRSPATRLPTTSAASQIAWSTRVVDEATVKNANAVEVGKKLVARATRLQAPVRIHRVRVPAKLLERVDDGADVSSAEEARRLLEDADEDSDEATAPLGNHSAIAASTTGELTFEGLDKQQPAATTAPQVSNAERALANVLETYARTADAKNEAKKARDEPRAAAQPTTRLTRHRYVSAAARFDDHHLSTPIARDDVASAFDERKPHVDRRIIASHDLEVCSRTIHYTRRTFADVAASWRGAHSSPSPPRNRVS